MKLPLVLSSLLVLFVSTTSADFWSDTFGGKTKWKRELKRFHKKFKREGKRILKQVADKVDNVKVEHGPDGINVKVAV